VSRWLLASVIAIAACGGDLDPASRITSFRTIAMRATRVVQSDTCDAGLVAAADARPGVPAKLGKTKCEVPGSYAHPGDEVQLDLLWHVPEPEASKARSWAWTTCLNPTSTAVFGCFQKLAADLGKLPPDQRAQFLATSLRLRPAALSKTFEQNELAADPASDPRTIFRVKVPDTALKELEGQPSGAKRAATMGIVFLACPGQLRINADPNAARNALPFTCEDENGNALGTDKFTIGIKRLFLREKDNNDDPKITGVKLDGQPWGPDEEKTIGAVCNGDEARFDRCDDPKHEITLDLAQPYKENGTDEFGETFSEQSVVQYYVTEGLFEFDVKRAEDPKTRFAGRRGKLGPQLMWIVIRDNRGGVSWVQRKFRVVAR
jgi:hypothetical protein